MRVERAGYGITIYNDRNEIEGNDISSESKKSCIIGDSMRYKKAERPRYMRV